MELILKTLDSSAKILRSRIGVFWKPQGLNPLLPGQVETPDFLMLLHLKSWYFQMDLILDIKYKSHKKYTTITSQRNYLLTCKQNFLPWQSYTYGNKVETTIRSRLIVLCTRNGDATRFDKSDKIHHKQGEWNWSVTETDPVR